MVIDRPVRNDSIHYVQYANNLVKYYTFSKDKGNVSPEPDSFWAPGYPAFIAASIIIEDKTGINAYILIMYSQAVLGALTAVLTLLLGRFFLKQNWSMIPAIFVSLSPHLISIGSYLLTETLFSFLFLAAIYSFSSSFFNIKKWLLSVSGLLFGLSYLVNPVMLFTPILLVLAAGHISSTQKNMLSTSIKQMLIFCLIPFFVVVVAWSARNIISVPPSQSSSSDRLLTNLVIGSHSNFFDIWRANPRDPRNPATKDNETIKGSLTAFVRLLSARILENPGHYAKWYLFDKPILLWGWNIIVGYGDIFIYPLISSLYDQSNMALATYSIMKSLHYCLLGFATLGLYFILKKTASTPTIPIFLYITLIYISAVYVITQSEPRYSIALRPEMYLCAVFFISKTYEHVNILAQKGRLYTLD